MEEDEKREIFQTPSQFESRNNRSTSGAKKYLLILISIIVIGLIIFGVGRFITGGDSTSTALNPTPAEEAFPTDAFPSPTESADPTPTESEEDDEEVTPTPTPKPTGTASSTDKATGLDRSKLSVRIMNGSGVSGAAKKASDFLEKLGYNVIQIGNAETSDYEETEIQITKAQDDFLPLLKKDLSSDYTIASTTDEPASDEKADAVVIIGKE